MQSINVNQPVVIAWISRVVRIMARPPPLTFIVIALGLKLVSYDKGGTGSDMEEKKWRYQLDSRQEIRLAAGDFSPDGVLQYNLTTPLPFQNGDVLGVWQPASSSSVVRLYHDGQTGGPLSYETNFNPSAITINVNGGGLAMIRTTLLIHAITTGWFTFIDCIVNKYYSNANSSYVFLHFNRSVLYRWFSYS